MPLMLLRLASNRHTLAPRALAFLSRARAPLAMPVEAVRGTLVTCDKATKQFILHLDDQQDASNKFVLHDLDDEHVFVKDSCLPLVQRELEALMDRNTFDANA